MAEEWKRTEGTMADESAPAHLGEAIDTHAEVLNELIATLTSAKLIPEATATWLLERVQDGRTEVAAFRSALPDAATAPTTPRKDVAIAKWRLMRRSGAGKKV